MIIYTFIKWMINCKRIIELCGTQDLKVAGPTRDLVGAQGVLASVKISSDFIGEVDKS